MKGNSTLLCVSLATSDEDETRALLQSPDRRFDVGEVRLDYLQAPDLKRILDGRLCPVICTNRLVRDGGKWDGDDNLRLELLAEADALGADYIDCEIEAHHRYQRQGSAKMIVSYHNFQKTPSDLQDIARRIEDTDADVVKLATLANSIEDNLTMFRILETARRPTIAVTMGEHGHVSRVLGPKFGAFLVFAALDAKRAAAPGQVPVDDFIDLYRFRDVHPTTRCYGLIGNPVDTLVSHVILNAAFSHCGVDAVCLPFRVTDATPLISSYQALPIAGYSVTAPHCKSVIPLLDAVEPEARMAGVVDTIVSNDDGLCGMCSVTSRPGKGIEDELATNGDITTGLNRLAWQFERWTGLSAPRELMRDVMRASRAPSSVSG